MRIITLCILFMLSGMLAAQTIDNPTFKARSGSIRIYTCHLSPPLVDYGARELLPGRCRYRGKV